MAPSPTRAARVPVGSNKDLSGVIDGIARGALRTAADLQVDGASEIMGQKGQELLAERVLMQLPSTDALRDVIQRVGARRLEDA